ncbi:GNAT family N-acetyltransferase [uncultured Psychrobacillus sp.]|uniref:GNAT family N-acetyltransferase n=1 Tax=uncultured Psychrobacillus sp. TaxID=1551585 RepID=UPI002612247F|nr:GNAT family N-acetyltransferase [uncultured Psychrobacillus sp.]
MSFPILKTERLNLIEINEEHVASIYSIFSNEAVIQYYGMSPLTSVDQAAAMVKSFANGFEQKRSMRWGIVWQETGELIGTVGLNNLALHSKRTEIGYDLLPAHWRKGIVTEAVEAVIDYCFNELKLFRIGAVTFPQNKASFALLLKMGFEKEGVLKGYLYQDTESHDAFIFSITQPEWKK